MGEQYFKGVLAGYLGANYGEQGGRVPVSR